jgi:hypothetical protein
MTADQIITAIGFIGIGGILKIGFDYMMSTKKAKRDAQQLDKEKRYKAIILLCYAMVNFEREKTTLIVNRPDIQSIERLKNELNAELINMLLYASTRVIMYMKAFISNPNNESLISLAITMRRDLYGIRTKMRDVNVNIYS